MKSAYPASGMEYLKVGKPVDRYFEKYYQTWKD